MKLRLCLLLGGFVLTSLAVRACEVCGAGQPKIITEYTHGKTPGGPWDYAIVLTVALGTFGLLPYAVRCVVRPGETASSHIKNSIITQEEHGD